MTRAFAFLLFAVPLFGCIKPPEIVMVDRATALEQQTSGSFGDLERRLARGGIAPKPVPLTPAQLDALGIGPTALTDNTELTVADRIDGLLVQHCIGESKDGRLADTRDHCRGTVDQEQADELMDRVNRARIQLWHWMQEQKHGSTVDEMRKAWHDAHLRGVVCDGWIEAEDGRWEAKSC